ncbi:MAG: 50S ribosomal protein L6 [Ethanoligenens sp.]|uniref:50S ribosomal protein L6 n=1 Tax=Ethanoligenens sp. TaxID=2099655 RepID=UPI0039ED7294
MSRIGKQPIEIPNGVNVTLTEGNTVTVKGPKGELTQSFHPDIKIAVEGNVIHVTRPDDEKQHRALHGLTRSLVANMVHGVVEEFKKELEINGVGYRAAKQGTKVTFNLGYSHPVIVEEVPGITLDVPAPNKIIIHGPDKQQVGQFAAELREKRPPEPYKGKGIKYIDEVIHRKEGKAGKGGKK